MPCLTGTPDCNTSVSGDKYGVLSGYNTAMNYDLATGLGSVDAAKLVNEWQSVSFTPSATSLTLNNGATVNIMHGGAVPVQIGVTPSAATGNVALMAAPPKPGNAGIASFNLASGSVVTTTAMLPGGSYSVVAHYGGDSNYGGSYSNTVPVTVSPESSVVLANLLTTDVNGNPISYTATSATYGSGHQIFRADVGDATASISPSAGISSQCSNGKESCPTGSVKIASPGTVLDGTTLQLNIKGFAEAPVLSAGTYNITASYSGDASYNPSSTMASFTIAKAPTTASAGISEHLIEYGNDASLGAGISTTSDGVAPKGTFQIYIDGSPLGQPIGIYESGGYGGIANGTTYYAWADAQSTTSFLTLGGHTISTEYSGDLNYAGSTSAPAPFTVVQAIPFFLGFGVENPIGSPVIVGQTATAIANLYGSQHGVAPTGSITFYDNGTALSGTVTYTSSSDPGFLNATIHPVFTTPGTHQITASYSGDANYTSAATTDPAQTINVLGPVSVTPSGTLAVTAPGQSGSVTLAIAPNGNFTGAVMLSCAVDSRAVKTTCGFTSGSTSGSTLQVNVAGSSVPVAFDVTTTATQTTANIAPGHGSPFKYYLAFVFLLLPIARRHRTHFIYLVLLAAALGLSACGGGSAGGGGGETTIPGTPSGTYTFTVTATTGSGSNLVTLATPVTVQVE